MKAYINQQLTKLRTMYTDPLTPIDLKVAITVLIISVLTLPVNPFLAAFLWGVSAYSGVRVLFDVEDTTDRKKLDGES